MKMNLSKTNSLIALALVAMAFVNSSCKKDDPAPPASPLSILASVSSTGVYTPEAGTLFLYYKSTDKVESSAFVCKDEQWSAAIPLHWSNVSLVGANYPFFALAPAVPTATPATSTDQSTIEAYIASDQLAAYTAASKEVTILPLTFKHLLSQIKVSVNASVESTDPAYINPATATLTIGGVRTAYTINYDDVSPIVPAIATVAEVSEPTADIVPNAKAGSFYAIVPAQTFAAGSLSLTFTIDGKTYTWTNEEEMSSLADRNVVVNLNIQKSGISLATNGITLTDWDNSITLDNETIQVDGLTDGTPGAGNITPADGDVLELVSNGETGVYTYATTAWGSTIPLFWDDMPLGSSTFDALYTPAAIPAIGNEKDYYLGSATDVAFGAPINLTMTHAMAQIKVAWTKDESVTVGNTSINLQALEGISVADGIMLKDGVISVTGTESFGNGTAYIVAPQTLSTEQTIKFVSDNGHVYTARLMDIEADGIALTALEAGKIYNITLKVLDKEVALSVTIQDWTIVEGGGEAA